MITRSSLSASCPPSNLGSVFALCEASFPSIINEPLLPPSFSCRLCPNPHCRWSYLFYHLPSVLLPAPSTMQVSVKVPSIPFCILFGVELRRKSWFTTSYCFQAASSAPGLWQQPALSSFSFQSSSYCSSTTQPASLGQKSEPHLYFRFNFRSSGQPEWQLQWKVKQSGRSEKSETIRVTSQWSQTEPDVWGLHPGWNIAQNKVPQKETWKF